MSWKITLKEKVEFKEPILLAGLPGIGNVGKIAVDFIIEELKAKKLYDFFSNTFPNSVFVNDKNLIELPSIAMYYIKTKKKDILILTGDIQPQDEKNCYDFCSIIQKIASDLKTKMIITLGGIGLREEPIEPKLFASGNNKKTVEEFIKKHGIQKDIYGVVGPIVGVSGVLPGISNIPSVILLAETFGHPFYVGIKGAQEALKVINKEFELKLDLEKLAKKIKELEENVEKSNKLKEISENPEKSTSYIG